MIILGPKTAILGPQFCKILVLGPHFWWSGGAPGSAPDLDDFLFVTFCEMQCNRLMDQFMDICEEIKFPLSLDTREYEETGTYQKLTAHQIHRSCLPLTLKRYFNPLKEESTRSLQGRTITK